MSALPQNLVHEVTAALNQAGRNNLAARFLRALDGGKAEPQEVLTSRQAADLLGVSSANTVKNWLKGGFFDGAYQTPGGHWRFPKAEVLEVKRRMEALHAKNQRGDFALLDEDGEGEMPLL
jgi:excisionase family DNA binding protein